MYKRIPDEQLRRELTGAKKLSAQYEKHPKRVIFCLWLYASVFDRKAIHAVQANRGARKTMAGMDRHSRMRLLRDVLLWYYAYGYPISQYFLYDFPHKQPEERLSYISTLELLLLDHDTLPERLIKDPFFKWTCYRQMSALYRREMVFYHHRGDEACIEAFVRKHKQFIIKPAYGSCGKGISLINAPCGYDGRIRKLLRKQAPCILEEPVIQSPQMAKLNESSVNTIRLITQGDKAHWNIMCIGLRIGRKGSLVDNTGSGGVCVLTDISSHTTVNRMYCDGLVQDGAVHPDSGADLSGFELPDWDNLLHVLGQAVQSAPEELHYIGWDFAHTVQGWILIEMNICPFAQIPQVTAGHGLAEEYRHFFSQYPKRS